MKSELMREVIEEEMGDFVDEIEGGKP